MKMITFRKPFDNADTAAETALSLNVMDIGCHNRGVLAHARKVVDAFWVYLTISGTDDEIDGNDLRAILPGFMRVA